MKRKVTGVPAFLIGEDMVVGLDQTKLLELIDHRLIECEECHKKLRVPDKKGKIKVTCPNCSHSMLINR